MDTGVLETSDGNAPQSAFFKHSNFTRDTSLASGTQAVTGVGFQPKAVVFFSCQDNLAGRASWGVDDGTNSHSIRDSSTIANNQYNQENGAIVDQQSGSQQYKGVINSLDSDGFTIGWTKTGSSTGTLRVIYLAIR